MGIDCSANGNNAIAMGIQSRSVAGTADLAIGNRAWAEGIDLYGNGIPNPGLKIGAIALGTDISAVGYAAIAIGYRNDALGNHAIAIGNGDTGGGVNEAHGVQSIAIGQLNKAYVPDHHFQNHYIYSLKLK